MKSVLVDFLVSAGLKPTSIVSYNHLGNNDGKNLSAPKQFRSKEVSFFVFFFGLFVQKLDGDRCAIASICKYHNNIIKPM